MSSLAETVEEYDLGYRPRTAFIPFHRRQKRWAVMVCHRRAGKTVACIMDLIDSALCCNKPNPHFAYIAPLYRQAKQAAWDYLKEFGLRVPDATTNESELRLDLPNGGRIQLFGADANPDALRGTYYDGVILDEAGDMSARVFDEILRPALSDRQGWCVWIGTPKGPNDFHETWERATKKEPERYYTLMLRAGQSGILDPAELADARRTMLPEQYAQEYECSFTAAVIGAYYGREMEEADAKGRLVKNLCDKTLQVHTAWDLGIGAGGQTAIWFYQQSGFEVRVIDYYAANGFGFDHYAKVLQDRGYRYGRHYLPHDVTVKELGTGRSRLETLDGLGIRADVVRRLEIADGINAVRRILPRCFFDVEKCEEGIKALRLYRREWDDTRRVFYERPYHDWASHPADAFRYLAVGLADPTMQQYGMKIPKRDLAWVV